MRRSTARVLAVTAIDAARSYLARYAHGTDAPDPGIVDAADLLDEAVDYLALADSAGALKGTQAGEP